MPVHLIFYLASVLVEWVIAAQLPYHDAHSHSVFDRVERDFATGVPRVMEAAVRMDVHEYGARSRVCVVREIADGIDQTYCAARACTFALHTWFDKGACAANRLLAWSAFSSATSWCIGRRIRIAVGRTMLKRCADGCFVCWATLAHRLRD